MKRGALAFLLLAPALVLGQAPAETQQRLDGIRADLVELRFEEALAGVETLLGERGLTDAERADALILRAEAHVALGQLEAAEDDYRAILRLRPDYAPDASLTPRKAMARFETVESQLVGRLAVQLTPADARLLVDGQPVAPDPTGQVRLLAGEHRVRAEREGFDAAEQAVSVAAGKEQSVELRLVPNARSVVVYTEPDDVEVKLDGQAAGRTTRVDGPGQPARLELAHLTPGEHVFEFEKPCYRTLRRSDLVTVDLLDAGPKHYGVVELAPARATVVLSGIEGAEVSIDGLQVGSIPTQISDVCPGERALEVRDAGRRIWSGVERLAEGDIRQIDVLPRPNVVLVGEEHWPLALAPLAGCCNVSLRADWPAGEIESPSTWAGGGFPADTDLVLIHLGAVRAGQENHWRVFSPPLGVLEPLEAPPPGATRPDWMAPAWGLFTVDGEVGGPSRVADVTPGGPAARAGLRAGDRLLSIDGQPAEDSRAVAARLAAPAARAGVEVEWRTPAGETRRGRPEPDLGPRLDPAGAGGNAAAWNAAWARADAVGPAPRRQAALANLALLLSRHGQHASAVEVWRRVGWPERKGVGAGTVAYYLGQDLEHLGRRAEAIEAYRSATTSDARAFHDEGPPIAGAARDRLVELGHGDRAGR